VFCGKSLKCFKETTFAYEHVICADRPGRRSVAFTPLQLTTAGRFSITATSARREAASFILSRSEFSGELQTFFFDV
jgi:hypothetical protein